MPQHARYADLAGGPIVATASTVLTNGKPTAVKADAILSHGLPPHTSAVMVESAGTVFANGKLVCRAGDKASCLHPVTTFSPNVFAE